eukprot:jgi/Mesvir1/15602/Mv03211-RA.1
MPAADTATSTTHQRQPSINNPGHQSVPSTLSHAAPTPPPNGAGPGSAGSMPGGNSSDTIYQPSSTYLNTPAGGPGILTVLTTPWASSLMGCCETNEGGDCTHCCEASLCPCWMFGKNTEIVSGVDKCHACWLWSISFPAMWLLGIVCTVFFGIGVFCLPTLVAAGCAYPTRTRADMRQRLSLEGSLPEDLAYHCCCPCCAISQEKRELRRLGYTTRGSVPPPSHRQVVVQQEPPPAQVMAMTSSPPGHGSPPAAGPPAGIQPAATAPAGSHAGRQVAPARGGQQPPAGVHVWPQPQGNVTPINYL